MYRRTIPLVLAATLFLTLACGSAGEDEPRTPRPARGPVPPPTELELEDAAEDFDEVRTGFLEWYFEAHPVRATELGVHTFDGRLPVMDRQGIQRRIDDLLQWLADLEQLRFDLMREDDRYDYAVLEYGIRSELLRLEESRAWANDPGLYTELIARGLATVVERDAPFGERAEALRDRLAAAPRILASARSNLERPPQVWTELGLVDARGLLEYLRQLPTILEGQTDSVPAELESARAGLEEELAVHIDWLQSEMLPRSTGTYQLGRYLLERKLLYDEHISLSLEELERLNLDAINEYREKIADVAATIDPDRSPREIIDSITRIGPEPDQLVPRAREAMEEAREWVVRSGVVPLPSEELPIVRESPPYARLPFASLDAPGPFDGAGGPAFYNLTNARSEWGDSLTEEHLTYFSDAGIVLTTLHTTFPGHWVQEQYARDLTDLRRVMVTRTFAAGWAHYAVEMALDEGFSDDPAVRLEQLRRSLQRHARLFAVVRLHAMGEPVDQVVQAFMEIAYFEEFPARREVLRATRDPGLVADALGRMQILELRDDYREYLEEEDEVFSLSEFHTRLLRTGLPFPLAREVLIPVAERPTLR